ncbi:phosphotransferase [Diaporthe helianthi]|uniref:Phosphotransferase n=1 Tax=Diaporthe helianthi TaxID=158607 RepID=A0A2P5HW90_DIAHE|nr:phosphotransferase [Diaporthe helianthi]
MPESPLPEEIAASLLALNGLEFQSSTTIQSLWAGYGEICRVVAKPSSSGNSSTESSRPASTSNSAISTPQSTSREPQTFILKLVTPPPTRSGDEGHTRKILSYQVEQFFYSHLAPQMPSSLPVAKCLGSVKKHHKDGSSVTATLLSDLRVQYPVAGEKRDVLSQTQVHAALDWLSGFHGFWWPRAKDFERSSLVLPPLEEVQRDGQDATDKTVWLNGGYTYLATRLAEYKRLAGNHRDEWNGALTSVVEGENMSIAQIVAAYLAPSRSGTAPSAIEEYQTLIHGDVKSENLFTSTSGSEVAFYDFQYTGLGLGVCDLAKLFTCSVPLSMLVANRNVPHELEMQPGEQDLLKRYWARLKETGGREYDWAIFVRHWETALVDWLRFQASWGFWGNTEWLEARVRSILSDEEWRRHIISGAQKTGFSGHD